MAEFNEMSDTMLWNINYLAKNQRNNDEIPIAWVLSSARDCKLDVSTPYIASFYSMATP